MPQPKTGATNYCAAQLGLPEKNRAKKGCLFEMVGIYN